MGTNWSKSGGGPSAGAWNAQNSEFMMYAILSALIAGGGDVTFRSFRSTTSFRSTMATHSHDQSAAREGRDADGAVQ